MTGRGAFPARRRSVPARARAVPAESNLALPSETDVGEASFARRVFFVLGILVLAALAWLLSELLLLLFGAVVLATGLRAIAVFLERKLHVPPGWSLAATLVCVIAAVVALVLVLGGSVADRVDELAQRLPQAMASFRDWIGGWSAGARVLERLDAWEPDSVPWAKVANVTGLTLSALGSLLLLLVMAVYLAAAPVAYRQGFAAWFPARHRSRVHGLLESMEGALRRWLAGQLLSMTFIGAATGAGLWALGIPLALTLGVVTGLLAFVPFFGALAGGVLAVLLAFLDGPRAALYVVVLFLFVQQLEEYVLLPWIQRWSVNLPPVAGLFATVAWGMLLGLPGVLVAAPLTVALTVLWREAVRTGAGTDAGSQAATGS